MGIRLVIMRCLIQLLCFNAKTGRSGAVAGKDSVLPLDMAQNSVDDMYNGCQQAMKEKVKKEYLQNEKEADKAFRDIWDKSVSDVHIPFWRWFTEVLKKKQIVAVRTYTDDSVFRDFNDAVQTQGPQYKTTFRYHALHFLLTTAIQINEYFSQDVENKEIRFGRFTSASQGGYADKMFGEKSCFEIFTCMGADISRYSKYLNEAEVLIPPYEVFKVVKIERPTTKSPCEVVYKVKSTENYVSKLNCLHKHGPLQLCHC
uniref:NAD(P)(+)--arginine ADP-ribosyltransferase n=1 Tax=Sander lucioperca TaxID=283035 RepID=A0A8C9YUG3_SANLU